MLIIRREETLIPQSSEGKRFTDDYEKRLHEQGALRARIDIEGSQWIKLLAEYHFELGGENGEIS